MTSCPNVCDISLIACRSWYPSSSNLGPWLIDEIEVDENRCVAIELSSRRGSRDVTSLNMDDSLSLTIDAVSNPREVGAMEGGLDITEKPEMDDAAEGNPPK